MKAKKPRSIAKRRRLKIRELEKKILPTSKKPPLPPPYAPGTLYGLASRRRIAGA